MFPPESFDIPSEGECSDFSLNLLSEGRKTDLSHVTTCSAFWVYRYCIQYLLEFISDKCPLPPKPGFGVWMSEGLSGGSSAGLTLERYGQLAVFAIQPAG